MPARYYANLHGYSGAAVQISWPTQCIRVQVTEDVAPIFAAIVWNGTFSVHASASGLLQNHRHWRLGADP